MISRTETRIRPPPRVEPPLQKRLRSPDQTLRTCSAAEIPHPPHHEQRRIYDWQTGGGGGDLRCLANAWRASGVRWCVIGGLAVNHWAKEPIVTQDAELVVAFDDLDRALSTAQSAGFSVTRFEWSANLKGTGQLAIQVTVDPRYFDMAARADEADVCGMKLPVASLEDTFQGKLWAWSDAKRRPLKRRKDELDLLRLAEAHPELTERLPATIRI